MRDIPESELEDVFERYGNMVYRLAFAYARSKADADDIFQEVFLRYYRRAPAFQSEEHRKAWLLRVTINHAKSCLSARAAGDGGRRAVFRTGIAGTARGAPAACAEIPHRHPPLLL